MPASSQRHTSQELLDLGFANDRTTGKEDWLTPPFIKTPLGAFDLDPCSPIVRPWDTAAKHYTALDDGLKQPWEGRVWLNPPYGLKLPAWMKRLAKHGNGVALIFARTETKAFFPWVWSYASGFLWIEGRLRFYTLEGKEGGTAGAPSVLIAYGLDNAEILRKVAASGEIRGHYQPNQPTLTPNHEHPDSLT